MNRPTAFFAKLPFFYGWIVVAVAFITMGIAINARTSFSLLFPAILDEYQWDRGLIAGAFSLGFIVSSAAAPVFGYIMDRWSPRIAISLGALMVVVGLGLATALQTPLALYLTLGVLLVSGSMGMSYISHAMFLPNWFARKRGLAIGIAFSGVGIGSITLLPWFQRVIDVEGWRQACIVIALAVIFIIPLNMIFQRGRPQELGLEPDGDDSTPQATSSPHPDTMVDRAWTETDWTLPKAMRTARFWWLFVGYFTALYVWYSVLVHQTVYLVGIGFDTTTSATALGLVALFGVGGQIGIGALSDRIGREWGWTISIIGFAFCYVALIELQSSPSPLLLYLMVFAQGGLGFGFASVFGPVCAEIFAGPRYATIMSVVIVGGNLGAGVGPWVTGLLFDITGSYLIGFQLCLAMCVISIVCIWVAAPRKVRLVAGQAAKRARR